MADPLKQLDSVVKQLEQYTDEISSASALASTLSKLSEANRETKQQVDLGVQQLTDIVTEISSYLHQSTDFSVQVVDRLDKLKFELSTNKSVINKSFEKVYDDLKKSLDNLSELRSQSTDNTSLIHHETHKIQEKNSIIESKIESIKQEELVQIKESLVELRRDNIESAKRVSVKMSVIITINAVLVLSISVLIAQSFKLI